MPITKGSHRLSTLQSLPQAQRERLAYIDFCLEFGGSVSRSDLIERFGMGLAAATRDLAKYRELATELLELDHSTKTYLRPRSFKPLFIHDARKVLADLVNGDGNGSAFIGDAAPFAQTFNYPVVPDAFILASIVRAIRHQKALSLSYLSLSSGKGDRDFVPHSLINNGHRWHVRGFDRKNQGFRDLVLTRVQAVKALKAKPEPAEMQANDAEWQTELEVELVPHPRLSHPEAIELDYQMEGGLLRVNCRAALLGYMLQQWAVDCSKMHCLKDNKYLLALNNRSALEQVANLTLAPGFDFEIEAG